MVSELLFSGGLVAVLRGVEPPEIITCWHARAARFIVGRDGLGRNLFSIPCFLIWALDDPPRNRGALSILSIIMAVTLLVLRVLLPSIINTYMSSSSPLCRLSYLFTTTPSPSLLVALHDDSVVKITLSQGRTNSSSLWPRDGTRPSTRGCQIPRCKTFNAFIVVSNVVDPNRRSNARPNIIKTSSSSTIPRRLLLKLVMPMLLRTIFRVSRASS